MSADGWDISLSGLLRGISMMLGGEAVLQDYYVCSMCEG